MQNYRQSMTKNSKSERITGKASLLITRARARGQKYHACPFKKNGQFPILSRLYEKNFECHFSSKLLSTYLFLTESCMYWFNTKRHLGRGQYHKPKSKYARGLILLIGGEFWRFIALCPKIVIHVGLGWQVWPIGKTNVHLFWCTVYILGQQALSFSNLIVHLFPSWLFWGWNQVYCAMYMLLCQNSP